MAYMYKIDTFIQSNVDNFIANTPITANLLFIGVGVLGICLIIAGIFRK
jgi:hypothetical protein